MQTQPRCHCPRVPLSIRTKAENCRAGNKQIRSSSRTNERKKNNLSVPSYSARLRGARKREKAEGEVRRSRIQPPEVEEGGLETAYVRDDGGSTLTRGTEKQEGERTRSDGAKSSISLERAAAAEPVFIEGVFGKPLRQRP
ncbi:hypothetical protein MRX96_014925 [Rhipicephalus microplus]